MAGVKRPDRETFASLAAVHTYREIADQFDVSESTVCRWSQHYDIQVRMGKVGRKVSEARTWSTRRKPELIRVPTDSMPATAGHLSYLVQS